MRPHHVKLAWLGLACLAAACAESGESPGPNAGSSATSGAGGETAADSGATGASGTGRAGRGGEPVGAGAASGGSPGAAGRGESGSGASGPTTGEAGDDGTTEPDDAGAAGCNLSCDPGQHCELVQVTCIRAPCPPLPMCVEDPRPAATNDCDPKKIMCRRALPVCPEGELPSVSGSCYGPCVPAESCACKQADECPNVEAYTCHLSAKHCGPYVN